MIEFKYGKDRWGGFQSVSLDIRCQAFGVLLLLWGISLRSRATFRKGVGFPIGGDGRRGCFLLDDRAGVGPLTLLYPRVFRVVSNKEASVYECKEGE